MRTWLVVAAILLAGCSGGSDAPQEPGTSPIAGDGPAGSAKEPFKLNDSGPLVDGIDESWDFSLDHNISEMEVLVAIGGQDPVPMTSDLGLEVTLFHNGSHVASAGGPGSTSASIGTSSEQTVFQYVQAAGVNETLDDHIGDWEVRLRGDPMPGTFSLRVVVTYK